MEPGQIVTFYSYKGGVGRSFALANTAVMLAQWGYRVLCIDWDLEAPGLTYFFKDHMDPPMAGLLEMVEEVRASPHRPPGALKNRTAVNLPKGVRLDLIAAGRTDRTYVSRLQEINWERLYSECDFGAVLESWREEWMDNYDVVLVDSRTGITDAGGICTAQVPDILVLAFTANQQNIDGVLDIADRAMKARDDLPYDRPRLMTVPLLSRFDAQPEYEQGESWRRILAKRFKQRLRDWAPKASSSGELLQRLTIPYFPIWSFGEALPVIAESHRNPEQVSYSIATLAALLARRLADVRLLLENRDSYVDTAVQAARRSYATDVFLSHGRATADLARQIIPLLHERQVSTYPASADEVTHFPVDRREIIDSCRHFVLLADEFGDAGQEQDLQYFLRHSVNSVTQRLTLPVVTSSNALRVLPPVVRNVQCFNLARDTLSNAADAIATQIADESGEFEFGAGRPQMASRFDVVISYAHTDRLWARTLAENLHRLGLDVWLDSWELLSGQRVASRLRDGLARADALVAVVSPEWLASEQSGEEFAAAIAATAAGRQRLIPVLLGEVDLPPFIASRQYVDFRTVASPMQYEDLVRQLVQVVRGRPSLPHSARAGELVVPADIVAGGMTGPVHAILRVSAESVVFSTAGSETSFTPRGVDHEMEQLMWTLWRERTRVAGGLITRDARPAGRPMSFGGVSETLTAIGTALGERFAGGEVAAALGHEIQAARARHAALRLGIQVDEPQWADLPWETLVVPGTDRPLALSEQVELYHTVRRETAPATAHLPGPLRILAVVASPHTDRNELLDYERELAQILNAVDPARSGHGAYVRVLNWGTLAEIHAALEQERFHILHLSCHAQPGALLLENDEGGLEEVDAQRFLDVALPTGRGVPLMMLAGCSTARAPGPLAVDITRRGAGDDVRTVSEQPRAGLARELMRRGVPTVLAMTDVVTDQYATELAARVYEELARAERPDPLAALSRARRLLETERERLASEDPRAAWPEWPTPALFVAGPPLPLFERGHGGDEERVVREPVLEEGMVMRKVGEFVGRRAELRLLLAALREPGKAGVLIHGIGGVGKSTLAAELLHHLGSRAGLVVPVSAATTRTVDALLEAVRQRLAMHCLAEVLPESDPLRQVVGALTDASPPWQQRWEMIRQLVLPRLPLLLVLDNAEDLLDRSDAGWWLSDPELAGLLSAWTTASPRTRLLITSRHPFDLPQRALKRMVVHHLGPLSLAETRKLIWRLPGLDALEPTDQQRAYADVGGHPRALEYLDALLRGGQARFPDIADRLETALEQRGIQAPERWLAGVKGDLDTALAETVTLAVDDTLLDTLLGQLDRAPTARRLLEGLAVYRMPVDRTGAAWQLSDLTAPPRPDPALMQRLSTVQAQIDDVRTSRLAAGDDYGLSSETIARYRRDLEEVRRAPAVLDGEAERALRLLLELGLVSPAPAAQDEPGNSRANGFLVHRWTAEALQQCTHHDTLTAAHRRAAAYWRWRAYVWPQDSTADIIQLIEARHHHHQAADLDEADGVTQYVCGQLHTWGAWDWERRLFEESLTWYPTGSPVAAAYMHQLGVIAEMRGEYREAEQHYRTALATAEELGNRASIATTYHQLGTLAQLRGEYDEAEQHYRTALAIAEDLGNRASIAGGHHQLGMIAQLRGEYDEAEQHYRTALAIAEDLGNRAGIATTYHQLGWIAQDRGDYEAAEQHYRASLAIKEELGNRVGIATGYHQLGMIAQLRGEYREAEQHYRTALAIAEDLGDRAGIAASTSQLGAIAELRGDHSQAEKHYRTALVIAEELGDRPGVGRAHHQLGVLAQDRGDYDRSGEHYRTALSIAEELGDRAGIAAGISQLGALHTEQQHPEQGITYNLQALALRLELGASPRTDLYWLGRQRALLGDELFRSALRQQMSEPDANTLFSLTQTVDTEHLRS
ncbi:tetratricopeptide repeat protein [Streptomyces sp. NPDC002730]|uniref:tetratricopeptide repeat protein n=1 Tax=Streptomyces sp. NPDC002730 TaxID=3364662 RepID=UPI0036B6B76E